MPEKDLARQVEESVQYARATEHLMAEEKTELVALLKENLALSQQLAKDMKKIKRHMAWRTVFNIFWLILIIAPFIFTIFYLPQMIDQIMKMYSGQFTSLDVSGLDVNALQNQLKLLK